MSYRTANKRPELSCNLTLQLSATHILVYTLLLELYPQLDPVPAASCSAWADLTDSLRLPELSETPDWRSVELPARQGSYQGKLSQHFIDLESWTSVLIETILK